MIESKKLFVVLATVFCFSAFLLPGLAKADTLYKVQSFPDTNQNGIYDGEATERSSETKTLCYEGFVPCGKDLIITDQLDDNGKCPATSKTNKAVQCQLCHFFIMINNTVNYVILKIVPILAVFMLVLAGVMYYFGGVRPELLTRAKTLIKGVAIGLALIYGAYMIVNVFLIVLGASETNAIKDVFHDGIFSIKCPIYVSDTVFKLP